MPIFTFQVDREYVAKAPLTLQREPGKGETLTVAAGDRLVFRGVVILDGVTHHTFYLADGTKGFSADRAAIEASLTENFDAVAQMSYAGLVEV